MCFLLCMRKSVGRLLPPPVGDGVRYMDLVASVALWNHVVHACLHRVGEDISSVEVELDLLAIAFPFGRFWGDGR